MSEKLPLSEFQPEPEVFRATYVQYDVGGALSDVVPRYEVLHSCGQWTRAEGNFCSLCGGRVQIPDEVALEIVPQAVPVYVEQQAELGSFNNPILPKCVLTAGGSDFNNDAAIIRQFSRLRQQWEHQIAPPEQKRLTSS